MNRAMWTATTRAQHMRDGIRLASDVTDAEWSVLEPLLPGVSPVGRPPAWPLRELVNAIFYVLRGGIPWRMLLRLERALGKSVGTRDHHDGVR
jgi:putative transposase